MTISYQVQDMRMFNLRKRLFVHVLRLMKSYITYLYTNQLNSLCVCVRERVCARACVSESVRRKYQSNKVNIAFCYTM